MLHGGSVRGNKLYESGLVTFGDLQAECPFPSACVVAKLDGGTLSACVQASRVPWSCGNLNALALHVDDGVTVDPTTHAVTCVGGVPLQPARLYSVVCALSPTAPSRHASTASLVLLLLLLLLLPCLALLVHLCDCIGPTRPASASWLVPSSPSLPPPRPLRSSSTPITWRAN